MFCQLKTSIILNGQKRSKVCFADHLMLEALDIFPEKLLEAGEGTGVLRDILTEFWFQFFQSLAIGAASKVPVICHDYQKREWKAIGRFLLYRYSKECIFPLPLSQAFVFSCILGEESISDEMLLKNFRSYISEYKETMYYCLEN